MDKRVVKREYTGRQLATERRWLLIPEPAGTKTQGSWGPLAALHAGGILNIIILAL